MVARSLNSSVVGNGKSLSADMIGETLQTVGNSSGSACALRGSLPWSLELEQANLRVRSGCDWKHVRGEWVPFLAEPLARSARGDVRGAVRETTFSRYSRNSRLIATFRRIAIHFFLASKQTQRSVQTVARHFSWHKVARNDTLL